MPPAIYTKIKLVTNTKEESFFANFRVLSDPGYLKAAGMGNQKKEEALSKEQMDTIASLKKGMKLPVEKNILLRMELQHRQNVTTQVL